MNYRTTLFLLVMLLIVGVAALVIYNRLGGAGPAAPEKPHNLVSEGTALFKAGDLTPSAAATASVAITTGDKSVELVHEGADWWQTRPVRWSLNAYSVDDLVNAAAGLRYTQSFTPGAPGSKNQDTPTLADTGLDKPLATVVIRTGGGHGKVGHTFFLGKRSLGGRAYLRLDKDPKVYLVGDALHRLAVDQTVNDWRRKTLTGPAAGSVEQAVLTREGVPPITLQKKDGQWAFAAPSSGRASLAAVGTLIGAVGTLNIDKFVADGPMDLAKYGLDKPTAVLTLNVPAAQAPGLTTAPAALTYTTKTLRIGAPADFAQDAYFATWDEGGPAGTLANPTAPPVVFQISKDAAGHFFKSVDDLRDPAITVVKAADVKEIAVARKDGPFKLMHGAGGWAFGDPNPGFAPDQQEAARVVNQLLDAQAKSYRPDAQPSGDPLAVVTITSIARAEPEVLRIYAPDKPSEPNLVLRQGETVGYLVPAEAVKFLSEPVLALRDRLVMDVPLPKLNRLVITRPGGERFEFTRQPVVPTTAPAVATQPAPTTQPAPLGDWKLTGQDKYDEPALQALLAKVAPLKATQWLAAGAPAEAKWDATIQLGFTDGPPRLLSVSTARRLGRVEGVPPFELDKSLVDAVDAEFRSRTVLAVSGRDLKRVVSVRGVETITVDRDAAGKYTSPDGQAVNQTAAGQMFDALGGLRIERYRKIGSLQVDLARPQTTLTIETATGTSHKLELWGPLHNDAGLPLARLDGGELLLELDAETATKLIVAPLLKPETPIGDMGELQK